MIAKNNIFNIRKGLGPKWKGETGVCKGFVEQGLDRADADVPQTVSALPLK